MECPILPVRVRVIEPADRVYPLEGTSEFVQRLQEALNREMVNIGFNLVPDGIYGEDTARALHDFMYIRFVDTGAYEDYRLFLETGETLAGCQTYNALGLDCTSVFPVMTTDEEFRIVYNRLRQLEENRPELFDCTRRLNLGLIIGGIGLTAGLIYLLSI